MFVCLFVCLFLRVTFSFYFILFIYLLLFFFLTAGAEMSLPTFFLRNAKLHSRECVFFRREVTGARYNGSVTFTAWLVFSHFGQEVAQPTAEPHRNDRVSTGLVISGLLLLFFAGKFCLRSISKKIVGLKGKSVFVSIPDPTPLHRPI